MINGIMDSTDTWTTNQSLIVETFTTYFKNLFSSKGAQIVNDLSFDIQDRVTDSMNNVMCQPFTADELKTSLFQMNPSKVPGSDGFPALFYQQYWSIIGEKLTEVCL